MTIKMVGVGEKEVSLVFYSDSVNSLNSTKHVR